MKHTVKLWKLRAFLEPIRRMHAAPDATDETIIACARRERRAGEFVVRVQVVDRAHALRSPLAPSDPDRMCSYVYVVEFTGGGTATITSRPKLPPGRRWVLW